MNIESLREDGRVVVDFPSRQIIAYPNISGHVVLMVEEDGERAFVMVEPEEIENLCAALLRAGAEAKVHAAQVEAEYCTFQVIGKAQGDGA